MLQATLPEIKLALSSKSRDLLSHVISECMQMRGRIVTGWLSAILANVSMNRKRKPTTQCLWKGLAFMNVSHKESSETLENIP